jgi:hypothetical protein
VGFKRHVSDENSLGIVTLAGSLRAELHSELGEPKSMAKPAG